MLKGVVIQYRYRWGGRLCLSRNSVSVFGEIEPNLFAACCQNGLGTAKGTIAGKLCAELASDVSSSLLDDQLADDEPSRLPPAPIVVLGASVILRWCEYPAGRGCKRTTSSGHPRASSRVVTSGCIRETD
jgi:hypothetical protein